MHSPLKRRARFSLCALAVVTALGLSPVAQADLETTGQVRGKVLNANGQSIAGANIILRNIDQGFVREVSADKDGQYNIKALPAGRYMVTVRHQDYNSAENQTILIEIGATASINSVLRGNDDVNTIEVVGTRVSAIDMSSTTSGLVIDHESLTQSAIAPDAVSIALKAPGVNQGDEDMGYLPSFGGASQGENAYFLNGLNITNIRSPFGYIGIPIEAVKQTSVEAGGVSASYGRFTGGAINQISKSGSNEFHYGISKRYQPEKWAETRPSLIDLADDGSLTYHINNNDDEYGYDEINLYASGPILQDKAFFYVLFSPSETRNQYVDGGGTSDDGTLMRVKTESDTFFGNFDWFITAEHSIGVMLMKTDGTTETRNFQHSPFRGIISERGLFEAEGETTFSTLNYSGQFGDLAVNARVGKIKGESSGFSGTRTRPVVWLRDTDGRWTQHGSWVGETDAKDTDERDMLRLDFDYEIGSHALGFGYDQDTTHSTTLSWYHGPNSPNNVWYYVRRSPFDTSVGFDDGSSTTIAADSWWIRTTLDNSAGAVDSEGLGYYIEDFWQLSNTLSFKLGIRNDTFQLDNAAGQQLYRMNDQWAPRLGVIWDVFGDQSHKAYLNFGRYYVAMPPSMAFGLGVPGTGIENYYMAAVNGAGMPQFDANDVPVLGTHLGTSTFNDGSIGEPRSKVADNLDPMYNDELLIGYEFAVNDSWTAGIRYVKRELGNLIEDASLRNAVLLTCERENRQCDAIVDMDPRDRNAAFRLINPGASVDTWFDLDGDGTLESIHLSKDLIGLPKGRRDYTSIELYFDASVDDSLDLHGSFVRSKLYGNSEGFTRSDSDSIAAGQTSLFNYAGTMENATGLLPNHHRNTIKLWGTFKFYENWRASFAYTGQDGRPMNEFGFHPLDVGACVSGGLSNPTSAGGNYACPEQYSRTNFYTNGRASRRGAAGETPWVNYFDAGVGYRTELAGGELQVDLTIFNVFGFDTSTQKEEWVEDGSAEDPHRIPFAGAANSWQAPRNVTLTVRYDF